MKEYLKKYGFQYKDTNPFEVLKHLNTFAEFFVGSILKVKPKNKSNGSVYTDVPCLFTGTEWMPITLLDFIFDVTYYNKSTLNNGQAKEMKRALLSYRDYRFMRKVALPRVDEAKNDYLRRMAQMEYSDQSLNGVLGVYNATTVITSIKLAGIVINGKRIKVDENLACSQAIYFTEDEITCVRPYLEDITQGDCYLSSDKRYEFQFAHTINHNWHIDGIFFDNVYSQSSVFLVVPYRTCVDRHDLSRFNTGLNETALLPFTRRLPNGINVFWREVEEASLYIVEYYVYTPRPYVHGLYLVKRDIIERGTCISILNDVVTNIFIVRVIAEDISGKVIAQSRGINIEHNEAYGFSQNWNDLIQKEVVVNS